MEGFEGFQDMISAMAMIAEVSKMSYEGFIAKGFSEKNALELTKQIVHEMISPIFSQAMDQALGGSDS